MIIALMATRWRPNGSLPFRQGPLFQTGCLCLFVVTTELKYPFVSKGIYFKLELITCSSYTVCLDVAAGDIILNQVQAISYLYMCLKVLVL